MQTACQGAIGGQHLSFEELTSRMPCLLPDGPTYGVSESTHERQSDTRMLADAFPCFGW